MKCSWRLVNAFKVIHPFPCEEWNYFQGLVVRSHTLNKTLTNKLFCFPYMKQDPFN